MRAASATALAIACAAACVAPGYDIVESIGDAGEGGTDGGGGKGGSGLGGRSGNGGSVSSGGSSTGADGGEDPGSGGASTGGASGSGKGGSSTGGKGGGLPTGGGPTGGGPTGGGPPTGGAAGGPPLGGAAGGPPLGGASGGPPMGGAGGTPIVAGGSGGGPMVGCDTVFKVSTDGYVRAPGASCWFGYAYTGGDNMSTVMPANFATCGQNCMLRSSGTLGPATQPDFAGVVYLGFNVNQTVAGTAALRAPAGNSLVVTWTKALGPAARVQLTGSGTDRWCANLTTSPQTIPYSSFNTQCWDNMGLAYSRQAIMAVQLVVPGGAAAQPIDITLVSVRDQ